MTLIQKMMKRLLSSQGNTKDSEDEEIVFLRRTSRETKTKGDNSKQNQLIRYGSIKKGHIKSDCPIHNNENQKKDKKKKKVMMASTWSDSDASPDEDTDAEEDIKANLSLMAQGDETEVVLPSSISFDELQFEFDSLYYDFEKLAERYKTLKKMNSGLMNELDNLKKELTSMQESKDTTKSELKHATEERGKLEHELNELKKIRQGS